MRKYIEKHTRIRLKNLKYDFLPSLQEVTDRPANPLGFVILFLILCLILSAFVWAYFYKLDIVVTAPGAVVPDIDPAAIIVPSGGRIEEISVKDGDIVKKGDQILVFSTEEVDETISKYREELGLLNTEYDLYLSFYRILDEGTADSFVSESYAGTDYAFIEEAVNLAYLTFRNSITGLDEIGKAQAISEQKLSVIQSINSAKAQIDSKELELENALKLKEKGGIRASEDGRIIRMEALSTGQPVVSGSTVGYIVPEDAGKVLRIYIADEDIGSIQTGDRTGIRIQAYADTAYACMDGKIISIEEMPVNTETRGNVYAADISVSDPPEDMKIGMEGSCDIITGQRSVLDYFLEPFRKGLSESMREK